MAKKLSTVLGIDIGSQSVKVAEVRAQGRSAAVTALGLVPTPEGAVDHTGIFNPDAVAGAIKQAIASSGASAPMAIVSVAGQMSVQVRTLDVPRMSDDELRAHMDWEISRSIPFAETTVQSDYRKLPESDPNSAQMEVVMAMAPQSAIDSVVECVRKAGKKPAAIDVEPLALGRSLATAHGSEPGAAICMVDMGRSTSAINIYSGGALVSPRQVPIGGEMFTRAIADALGLAMPDAEARKLESVTVPEAAVAADPNAAFAGYDYGSFDPNAGYAAGEPTQALGGGTPAFDPYGATADDLAIDPITGQPTSSAGGYGAAPADGPADSYAGEPPAAPPTPAPVPSGGDPAFEAIRPILDEFTAELRRSIDYFVGRGGTVGEIVLLGGGTKLRGLDGYIERSLGIPAHGYDPLHGLTVSARRIAPGFLEDHRRELAVAIGNGLHILFD